MGLLRDGLDGVMVRIYMVSYDFIHDIWFKYDLIWFDIV